VTKKLNRDRMRGPGDLAPARLGRLATVPNPNQGVQSDLSDEGVEQILREHNLPDNRLIWTPDLSKPEFSQVKPSFSVASPTAFSHTGNILRTSAALGRAAKLPSSCTRDRTGRRQR
jgi:hypothetical protein